MTASPVAISSKNFVIMLSILCLLISNAHAYGLEYPEHTESYMLGYESALHNKGQGICNNHPPDCINGFDAGLAALHHPSQSYYGGYKAGLNNQTFQEACPSISFSLETDYAICSQGFDAGRLAMEMPTIEYKMGWDWGKRDTTLFLFDGTQCKMFSKNINNDKYKICIDGYEKAFATYVYIKQPGTDSMIESFHQTLPYKMGYATGSAFNKNITAVCENFSGNNRNYTTCIKGWIDAQRFTELSQHPTSPYE